MASEPDSGDNDPQKLANSDSDVRNFATPYNVSSIPAADSDRHVMICFKKGSYGDSLPILLSEAIRARVSDMPVKTRVEMVQEQEDGHKIGFFHGNVMIFPEKMNYKGMTVSDIDSFVNAVLLKPIAYELKDMLPTCTVLVCVGNCGSAMVQKYKQESEIRGLAVHLWSNIEGDHDKGNLIAYAPGSNGIISGNWYGDITADQVASLFNIFVGKAIPKNNIRERLLRTMRTEDDNPLDVEDSSLDEEDDSVDEEDGPLDNSDFGDSDAQNIPISESASVKVAMSDEGNSITAADNRLVLICFKRGSEANSLPMLLSVAIRARECDFIVKTSVEMCEEHKDVSEVDFCHGDVMIFPEKINFKGLRVSDIDSFLNAVLLKPIASELKDILPARNVLICVDNCGSAVVEKFKKEAEIRGLTVNPCSNVEGDHDKGNLIAYTPGPNGNINGKWYGDVTEDQVAGLFDMYIGKAILKKKSLKIREKLLRAMRTEDDTPLDVENSSLDEEDDSVDEEDGPLDNSDFGDSDAQNIPISESASVKVAMSDEGNSITAADNRLVLICFKRGSEANSLPMLLSVAIRARECDFIVKTSVEMCEEHEDVSEVDFCHGDVMIFPEKINFKGLRVSDIDSFLNAVLLKPIASELKDILPARNVLICVDNCGSAVVEKFKKEAEIRGLTVNPCSNVEGDHDKGNLIAYTPGPDGNINGKWYGDVTEDQVAGLFDMYIGKAILKKKSLKIREKLLRALRAEDDAPLDEDDSLDDEDDSLDEEDDSL